MGNGNTALYRLLMKPQMNAGRVANGKTGTLPSTDY
jgi:hypothetical protein